MDGQVQRAEAVGQQADDPVAVLDDAGKDQEAAGGQKDAVRGEQVGADGDGGMAGFVFHGGEIKAFCGRRTLADDHHPGDRGAGAVGHAGQFAGGDDWRLAGWGIRVD